MRRLIPLIALMVASVSWLALRSGPTDANSIKGVWKAVHVTITSAEGTEEIEITQPTLHIYTAKHYATLRVGGVDQEPREMLPEDPTDEQLLAAYRRYYAAAGSYEVRGNEIHQKVIMHRNPNAMAAQLERSIPFEVDGDTAWATYDESAGTTFKVKYVRVE